MSHAGTALLAELADRSGLTEAMSVAMAECGISWHTHDPGVVLTHLGVAIADGADCLADLAALKEQEDLFGPVASVATAWRAIQATTSAEQRAIPAALAEARRRVWNACPPAGPLVFDVDSTLVTSHSEKEDAAPTYKRGFGFNPLGRVVRQHERAAGRHAAAGQRRPQRHRRPPRAARSGPCWRSRPSTAWATTRATTPPLVVHPILVRADSAGATHRFVEALSRANFEYSIGFPIGGSVRDALLMAQEEDWVRATEPGGGFRDGAEVIELTELVRLDGWPEDLRLVCRRERPHPGRPALLVRHPRRVPPHLLRHQHDRRRHRGVGAASPWARPGRGPGALLEGRAGWPTCPSTASAATRPG